MAFRFSAICVFCGSAEGRDPIYKDVATELGSILAEKGSAVIYGGAKIGLMGAVADGCLNNGGNVIGIIPDFLKSREIVHDGLQELIVTETMHERKRIMYDRAEGLIALPGGFGTMDELFEILTWAQLGLHPYPVGLLNVAGYYDHFLAQMDRMVADGFVSEENRKMILVAEEINELLALMEVYETPPKPAFLRSDQV